MSIVDATLFLLAFSAVAISAVTDVRTRKIKNWVTFPAILIALVLHVVAGGWDSLDGLGLKWSLIGMVVGCLPFLAMNTLDARAFGMGDVKLMAAVGSLLAWPLILEVLLYVALSGGVVAVVFLIRKKMLRNALSRMFSRKGEKESPHDAENYHPQYIPYGVAIAIGTVLVLLLEITRKGF